VNIKSEIVYAEGKSVVKSITEYASKNHIDLIVIGGIAVGAMSYCSNALVDAALERMNIYHT
jgi:hypothetical protein